MFTSSFMSPSDRFWAVTFFRPFLLGRSGRFCSASLKRLRPKMLMITEQDQDSKKKKGLQNYETTSWTLPHGPAQAPEKLFCPLKVGGNSLEILPNGRDPTAWIVKTYSSCCLSEEKKPCSGPYVSCLISNLLTHQFLKHAYGLPPFTFAWASPAEGMPPCIFLVCLVGCSFTHPLGPVSSPPPETQLHWLEGLLSLSNPLISY